MLYYLATRRELYPMRKHLRHYGRELRGLVRLRSYSHVLRARQLRCGAYIFSDVERLGHEEIRQATHVRKVLAGHGCTVLNDPAWSMRRYELLRTMHDLGINTTNVYRVTENRDPTRYPVFVRGENDHNGSQSELLHSREELRTAIERLTSEGASREQLLITEFCDTKDEAGVYCKYSAFYVRGEVIPRHQFFGTSWMLKSPEHFDQAHLDKEFAYHQANPHAEQLRAIFTAARIDYGRIDYGVQNGEIRVWEINTNPMISTPADATFTARVRVQERFAPAFNRALRALATSGSAAETIRIPKLPDTRKRRPVWRQFLTLFQRAA
jgi:hypothetical protein